MKKNISIITGFILSISSIITSIFFYYPYWYTPFIIGMFMLFGGLNYKINSDSVYSLILNKKWKPFIKIYLLGCLAGFLVDVIYGRFIADIWYYPHLDGLLKYIFPIFFYYPFGGLHVYEIFIFFNSFLSKHISNKRLYKLSNRTKETINNLLLIILILGVIFPVLNYLFNSNNFATEIATIFMILTIFSFDSIIYKLKKESVFFEIISINKRTISIFIITWLLLVITNEVPNIYSWEWIYHNVPFTDIEIFKINILIFTFGWFWLLIFSVKYIELVKILLKLD